jgi:hypothetical protein
MSGAMGGATPNHPWSLANARIFDDPTLGGPGDAHVNVPSSSWPFLPGKLDPNFTVTRAQASGAVATSFGRDDASLASWLADVPRYDGSGQSLLLEPGATNWVRNPRCEGYVAGTPGTMPTNWLQAMVAGVGITLLGTYKLGDMTVGRYRVFGTPTVGGACVLSYDWGGPGLTGQVEGTPFTQGVWCAMTGGSMTNISSVNHWVNIRDSLSADMPIPQNAFTPTASLKFYQEAFTMTGGTAPYALTGLAVLIYPVLNQPIDITLDIGAPSFVTSVPTNILGSVVLPPIGAPAVSTRADDSVTAPRSAIFPANRGTLLIDGTLKVDLTGSGLFPVLAAWYTDANNWFGIYFNSGTGRVAATGTTAGVQSFDTALSLPSYLIGFNTRIGMTFNASGAGGTHVVRVAARVGSSVGSFQIGGLTLPATTLFGFGRYSLPVAAPMSIGRAQIIPQVLGLPAIKAMMNA